MLFLVSEFVIKCGEISVECILFILFLFNCNKIFSEYAFIEQPIASIKVMGEGSNGQKSHTGL